MTFSQKHKLINTIIWFTILSISFLCFGLFNHQSTFVNNTNNVHNTQLSTTLTDDDSDTTFFTLDDRQLEEWNISNGNLKFRVIKQATHDTHGEVMIEEVTCQALLFEAENLNITDYVFYNQMCYDVVGMADFLFGWDDFDLVSGTLHIGSLMRRISDGCFGGLINVAQEKLIIPPNVTYIGDLAFNKCNINYYYLTSQEQIKFGIAPFGTDLCVIQASGNLIKKYQSDLNLDFYYITKFADPNLNSLVFDEFENEDTKVEVLNNEKLIYHDVLTISSDDAVNPSIVIEIENQTQFDANWISAGQSSDYQHIDLYINSDALTPYPNSFVFLIRMRLSADLSIYVTHNILVVLGSYSQNHIPLLNYLLMQMDSYFISDDEIIQIRIKNNRSLHFNLLNCCVYELSWPIQHNRFDLIIDNRLSPHCYFDAKRKCLVFDDENISGKFQMQIRALASGINLSQTFYLQIIKKPFNYILVIEIVAPILFASAGAFVTWIIIHKHKKHQSKRKSSN